MTQFFSDARSALATMIPRLCALVACLTASSIPALGQEGQARALGEPFRTVFPLAGLTSRWWRAEYDHSGLWQETGWRKQAVSVDEAGVRLHLKPTAPETRVPLEAMNSNGAKLIRDGKISKKFVSGQLQNNKWFGYGRFEIVMQVAAGAGLISAFYLYTGRQFGDTHEELDIEILGKDSSKVQFNRFRDGKQYKDHPWMDLGIDSAAAPHLYAFEWSEDSISWYVGDRLMFWLDGAEQMPRPPMKIYVDLWAGGAKHATWSGVAPEGTRAEMLVQCVSYSPLEGGTPTCGDLMDVE